MEYCWCRRCSITELYAPHDLVARQQAWGTHRWLAARQRTKAETVALRCAGACVDSYGRPALLQACAAQDRLLALLNTRDAASRSRIAALIRGRLPFTCVWHPWILTLSSSLASALLIARPTAPLRKGALNERKEVARVGSPRGGAWHWHQYGVVRCCWSVGFRPSSHLNLQVSRCCAYAGKRPSSLENLQPQPAPFQGVPAWSRGSGPEALGNVSGKGSLWSQPQRCRTNDAWNKPRRGSSLSWTFSYLRHYFFTGVSQPVSNGFLGMNCLQCFGFEQIIAQIAASGHQMLITNALNSMTLKQHGFILDKPLRGSHNTVNRSGLVHRTIAFCSLASTVQNTLPGIGQNSLPTKKVSFWAIMGIALSCLFLFCWMLGTVRAYTRMP